jgi:hypothetical protein
VITITNKLFGILNISQRRFAGNVPVAGRKPGAPSSTPSTGLLSSASVEWGIKYLYGVNIEISICTFSRH